MKRLAAIPVLALLVAASPPSEPVDAVALALARGIAAEQSSDGAALLEAASVLDANGARPADADAATQWRDDARRRGAKMHPTSPWRGRALGPAYRSGVLGAGETLVTEQVFLAGRKAQVALVPQPARSLAIRIVAPDDKSLCDREAAAPRETCNWLPLFTARVRIHVVNRSRQPARYFLVSN